LIAWDDLDVHDANGVVLELTHVVPLLACGHHLIVRGMKSGLGQGNCACQKQAMQIRAHGSGSSQSGWEERGKRHVIIPT
jgi:hypothetical protein